MNKKKDLQNIILTILLHDIQSPLRFIKTIMQELVDNYNNIDANTLQEHFAMVHASIISLQEYCNKINAWNKAINIQTPKAKAVNINDMFMDIKNIYTPLIAYKKINFTVVETKLYCLTDKEILFIIIANLIDNAYKYTDAGNITLSASSENNMVLIVVSDSGIGISEKAIKDILENNFELQKSSVGYYIINNLLKKINGKLAINSVEGKGTKVTLSLLNPEKYGNAFQGL